MADQTRTPATPAGSDGVGALARPAHRLSLARIAAASGCIEASFRDSPQFEAATLSRRLGCRVVVKIETLNPIRCFKGRGAQFLTAQLQGQPPLTCATAGNFGQGMAHAARARGLPLTIFTTADANPLKVERMRAFGADVRPVGREPDDAHEAARLFAARTGALLVEDGRNAAIAEGAGTIGVELLRWQEAFDAMLVPLGDGALLAGVARWVKAHCPSTQMIGVCAAGAPAMQRSWLGGEAVRSARTDTIADGIDVRTPFAEAVNDLVHLVEGQHLPQHLPSSLCLCAIRIRHNQVFGDRARFRPAPESE